MSTESNEIREVILERVPIYARSVLPEHMIRDMDVDVVAEMTAEYLVASLRTWVVAGKQPQKHTTTVQTQPLTLWDAIKHFLPWGIARWFSRVKYREREIICNTWYICPHVDVPAHSASHIVWMMGRFDMKGENE